jgi:hypothetical protein
MPIVLSRIENPQDMEVFVNGPQGANRMFIYTGTAVFSFKVDSEKKWKRGTLSFKVGRKFEPEQIVKIVATASLASVFDDGSWRDGGWAVDLVDADLDDESGEIEVRANLAMGDTDGYLYKIGYQVTVLAAVGNTMY